MADLKKFLDQQGVSTLWSKIAEKVAADVAAEAKLRDDAVKAEAAARAEAMTAEATRVNLAIEDVAEDVADLATYVGTIPTSYTESSIVAFIQKRAQEVLDAAQGGSSETAASVKNALDTYIAENDAAVEKNADDIAAIVADYLKATDKTELADNIAANAGEIARIDAALKAAVENEGAGLDSIKELASWIEEHGEDAAGYAAAIQALEALVGDETVAAQIAAAIAAENLAQYAKTADIEGTLAKVDTEGTVTAAINAAITALNIGDYAKAADLTDLAARVAVNEGAIADLQAADISLAARIKAMEDKVPAWDVAESNAKAYTDSEITRRVIALTTAEIEAAIEAVQA